ncbi:hypothetical protein CCMSSC00406_0005430 [Pleurotus cornucopiae]|uniref:Uncharacterized protein n=1 Tax=Pleurotus cornucopiae TaxID=5321 RepID=A0ACB7IU40_PLECO|nr:hypothetical protein CCMSSC00406_0005430 [Pleurotus cornucopiae]
MTSRLATLVWLVGLLPLFASADRASVEDLAQRYSLTTSTTLPFPTATQANADTQNLLVQQWSLGKGRIQDGADRLEFVADPFPRNSVPGSTQNATGPVLQATYPAGSFSHESGGAQFYNLWNNTNGNPFQSMIVSYELAFPQDFDWVKGGKLPGLRGGLNSTGCSGGNEPDGRDCLSARLMWRRNGNGEAYLYIPKPNGLCDERSISCNDDFGISVSRGSFVLTPAQWYRITMLVQVNNPPHIANGNLRIYFNDEEVIRQQDLQFRAVDSLTVNGFFFSTFFGGGDNSWATPQTTHTYYRNIRMWGGSQPSNLTGQTVNAAYHPAASTAVISCVGAFLLFVNTLV